VKGVTQRRAAEPQYLKPRHLEWDDLDYL
jgi:hypothetical protein